MFKSLLLLPVLALIVFPFEAIAADPCGDNIPEIEIIPTFGHVEKDRSLRAINLNAVDAWGGLMVDHIDGKVALKAQNLFKLRKPKKKGPETCVILSEVKILYKFDVTLKIIDDYPKDSCEYKATIAHEELHIAVAKEFLAQAAPMLREYILKRMKGKSVVLTKTYHSEWAKTQLNKAMNNLLADYILHMEQEHRKVQRKAVDTEAERAKLRAACPKWKQPYAYK